MFTFSFTQAQLARLISDQQRLPDWYQALISHLPGNGIDTPLRLAAFIAQCGHESGGFRVLRENLNYRWGSLRKTWPRHFPTDEIAKQYAHQPERIANRAYANRMGNGPESSGDGWRFAGRGLIQLTGKNNYTAFATSRNMDLASVPAYIETVSGAVDSACWFWTTNGLNQFADIADIENMTRRINGGLIGIEDRINRFRLARSVLGA